MTFTGKQKRNIFNPKSTSDLFQLAEGYFKGEHETCIYMSGGVWFVQRISNEKMLYEGKNEEETVKAFWLSVTEDE